MSISLRILEKLSLHKVQLFQVDFTIQTKSAHQKALKDARLMIYEKLRREHGKRDGASTMVRRSILDRISQELQNIRYRLDDLEQMLSGWNPQPAIISESKLISLPDHLRKTYMFVASKGECNATEVANLTGRSRAMESSYLNQLTRMGWLTKRRNSRTLSFRPISESVLRKQLRQEIR